MMNNILGKYADMSYDEAMTKLKKEYNDFIRTEDGQKWLSSCSERGFGDYLYEFYPHMILA